MLALAALFAGCRGGTQAPDRPIDAGVDTATVDGGDGRTTVVEFSVTPNRDIDILFVVDDSPSMLDKQTNLKNTFPSFINILNTLEGGLPNIHLGVVTSDLGTKGADDATAGPTLGSGPGSCSGNGKAGNLQTNGTSLVSGAFINDQRNADGTRTRNYTGTLADAFSAIASVGATGCGFEQHIEAAKRALNNNPSNSGFVRQNARLALIFIQDEDDCSMAHSTLLGNDSTLGPLNSFRCNRFGHVCTPDGTTPTEMTQVGPKGVVNGVSGVGCVSNDNGTYLTKVADYVAFFKGLKTNPYDVVVAGIAGPTTPYDVELRAPPGGGTAIPAVAHSCSYVGGTGQSDVADPSTRIVDFLNQFSDRNTFQTICSTDLSGALTQIAQLLRITIGSPCIQTNLADVDPATPGPQYDCIVSEISDFGSANQSASSVPRCDNATTPASSMNKPCWWVQAQPATCVVAPNLMLQIERSMAPPATDRITMRCKL